MLGKRKDQKKSDDTLKSLQDAFNSDVPAELKNKLGKMLDGFRQDLNEHPYFENENRYWRPRWRWKFPFHLPLIRFLLLTGTGLACVTIAITLVIGNRTATWADVEEQFREIPYCAASVYAGSPYTSGHSKAQYWISSDGRARIHSGDNISFVNLDEGRRYFRTYNVKTRTKTTPDWFSKNFLRSHDRMRQLGKPTLKSIIEAMSGENIIETTSLVISNLEVSKDLLVFDAESFDTLWNIRIWALRESKLPIRILKRHRRYDRYVEFFFNYSKEQPKNFFDPDAFEDKIENPVYTEHDLKYMFLQDPGRQSLSTSDR